MSSSESCSSEVDQFVVDAHEFSFAKTPKPLPIEQNEKINKSYPWSQVSDESWIEMIDSPENVHKSAGYSSQAPLK